MQSHLLKHLRCIVGGKQHGPKPGTRVNFLGEVREGLRFIQAMRIKGLESECVVVRLLPTCPVSAIAHMNFLLYVAFME